MASNWIKILNLAIRGHKITKIDRSNIGPDNFILHVTFDGIIIPDVPMTIKQLAVEMNKRFDQVDKRLDQVDRRLDQVDRRLDGHDVILKQHGEILKEHSEILKEYGEIFKRNNLK